MARADGFEVAGSLRVLVRQCSQGPTSLDPGLLIQRAARESWRADTGISGGRARTHIWCYLLRGHLRVEHRGQQQIAGPGQLVAVPQGQDYRLWVQPGCDLEHVIWNATGANPERWWQRIGRSEPCVLALRQRREVERCLEDLVQHLAALDPLEQALARHYFDLVLGLATIGRGSGAAQSARHAERCRELIEQRGLAFASARELAAALELHPDYLARVYRARFGASPSEHLRRHRMERATQALQDREVELAQIAAELGFSDAFAFSKAFKTYAGLSPRHWRQQFVGRG
jgi:AraC-like DNA-binding protein